MIKLIGIVALCGACWALGAHGWEACLDTSTREASKARGVAADLLSEAADRVKPEAP